MLQLLFTLFFGAIIFRVMWTFLGVREFVTDLLRDEERELREKLTVVEDSLADLAAEPNPDETSKMLVLHYEKEARHLRRRLARLNEGRRTVKEIS